MSDLHNAPLHHDPLHHDPLHHDPLRHDALHQEPWIETWWPFLIVAFGLLFVSCLVFFKPVA